MSDQPGSGWWQASDGKWYPPEAATQPQPQLQPQPQVPPAPGRTSSNRTLAYVVGGLVVLILAVVAAIVLLDDDDEEDVDTADDSEEVDDDEEEAEVVDETTDDDKGEDADDAAGVAPDGFRLVDDDAEGFSIAVPEGWQEFDSTAISGGALDDFAAANPELAPLLEQAGPLFEQGGLLIAIDTVPSDAGFSTNLNLVRTALPSEFDAAILEQQLGPTLEAGGIDDPVFSDVELANGPAVEAVYTTTVNIPTGGSVALDGRQFYLGFDGNLWVLSLTTDRLAEFEADFDTIADSFLVE